MLRYEEPGNKAETTTMIPVLHQFMAAPLPPEVTALLDRIHQRQ